MDFFSNIALGFAHAVTPLNLLVCFGGVFLGTLIGVLPGVGALAAVSILLPLTFYLDPISGIIMLAGVYYGAEYGGSTASILLRLPGTPSSAVTCLDGHPMARDGRAGVALFVTTIASFIGGLTGIILLVLLSPAIAALSLQFGPVEYVAIMVFSLIASSAVASGSPIKGLASVVIGLMLGTVGVDLSTAIPRFGFGQPELLEGVSLVALAMGLFGVSEVIASVNEVRGTRQGGRITLRSMLPTREDMRRSFWPMLRGSGLGSFFGILPGVGQSTASFAGYVVEKRLSPTPEKFGTGMVEGVASPEAANNAAVQTSFIPTLTLGIPGSATMAVLMGALMVHGIMPGPMFMANQPEIFWGLAVSFLIGNIILVGLNIPLVGIWVRLLLIPYKFLYPAIVVLVCIGTYAISYSVFDIWMLLLFGVMGYVMRLLDFEPAPVLIAFILGPMLEDNFRRSMLLGRGDPAFLFQGPISVIFWLATFGLLAWMLISLLRRNLKARAAGQVL